MGSVIFEWIFILRHSYLKFSHALCYILVKLISEGVRFSDGSVQLVNSFDVNTPPVETSQLKNQLYTVKYFNFAGT